MVCLSGLRHLCHWLWLYQTVLALQGASALVPSEVCLSPRR